MMPLFADIGDIIGILIPIVIVGFSILSNIISANKAKARPPQRRPPQRPPGNRPQPGNQAGGNQPQAARSIEAEIEDFLRQARGGGDQPAAKREFPAPDGRQQPPLQAPAAKPVVRAKPIDVDVVPGERFGQGIGEHVTQHIGPEFNVARESHLGEVIDESDERVERRLEETFDHDVGHLAHMDEVDTSIKDGTDGIDNHSWEEKVEVEDETPARIRELMANPVSIREVFIISEILKRPEI